MARMKRYTRWRGEDRVIAPKELSRGEKGEFAGPAAEQLAAYEDSGLTPAQVRLQAGELCRLQAENDELLGCVVELEGRIAAIKSEREYFRSRAEFFRELAERRNNGGQK